MSFLYLVLIGLGNRPKMLGLVCALNSGIGFILYYREVRLGVYLGCIGLGNGQHMLGLGLTC